MGSINLNAYKRVEPQSTIDDPSPHLAPQVIYRYKDISLDLEYDTAAGNFPANRTESNIDLRDLKDAEDVTQSINNIFNTIPGEKLLNPYLGLNLSRFVFDSITTQTADLIARTIIVGLPDQEPRVNIAQLSVMGNVPEGVYNVKFILNIPGVNIQGMILKGDITSDGFRFG